MWMWNQNFSDSTKHPNVLPPHRDAGFSERGYVDILCAATGRPSTMSGGDFSTLPRIADGCGVCVPAASKTQWALSLFGNDYYFLDYETREEANCPTGGCRRRDEVTSRRETGSIFTALTDLHLSRHEGMISQYVDAQIDAQFTVICCDIKQELQLTLNINLHINIKNRIRCLCFLNIRIY